MRAGRDVQDASLWEPYEQEPPGVCKEQGWLQGRPPRGKSFASRGRITGDFLSLLLGIANMSGLFLLNIFYFKISQISKCLGQKSQVRKKN